MQVAPVGQLVLVIQPFAVGVPAPVIIWQQPSTVGHDAPLGQLPLVTQAIAVGQAELVTQPLLDGQTELEAHP